MSWFGKQSVMIIYFSLIFCSAFAQTDQPVTFKNRDNLLSGTLTVPKAPGIHPAILIITGSGTQNRDGDISGIKPFKIIADALGKKGFIVLRYDNRSKGFSKWKAIEKSTTEELALDAQAAITYLLTRKEVNKKRIGLVGHSEGATIAAITTTIVPNVKFLLLLNGTSLTGFDDVLLNAEQRLLKAGNSAATIRYYLKNLRLFLSLPIPTSLKERARAARNLIQFEIGQLPASEQKKVTEKDIKSVVNNQLREVLSVWEKQYLLLNPTDYYKKISCPAILFFSSSDIEGILKKRLLVFEELFKKGKQKYTLKIIKHVDHTFIKIDTKPVLNKQKNSMPTDFIEALSDAVEKYI